MAIAETRVRDGQLSRYALDTPLGQLIDRALDVMILQTQPAPSIKRVALDAVKSGRKTLDEIHNAAVLQLHRPELKRQTTHATLRHMVQKNELLRVGSALYAAV
jgi:hypothetical protein